MRLHEEQEALLLQLVEAERRLPRNRREMFLTNAVISRPGVCLIHGGWSSLEPVFDGDLELLAQAGLINMDYTGRSARFYVTPLGFDYYLEVKQQQGEPLRRLERTQLQFIAGDWFQSQYPAAYEKWRQAEDLLWRDDPEANASTIGHLVREAMQEFAHSLVNDLSVPNVTADKASTVARVRAAIAFSSPRVGSTVTSLLEALLAYWGTLSDLVQRQEHAVQRGPAKPLLFSDSRRVVFHSAAVMFELHNTLR